MKVENNNYQSAYKLLRFIELLDIRIGLRNLDTGEWLTPEYNTRFVENGTYDELLKQQLTLITNNGIMHIGITVWRLVTLKDWGCANDYI